MMMNTYNSKISDRANESIRNRRQVVQKQKRRLSICVIIAISLIILLGTSMGIFASSLDQGIVTHKYYKSVRIEEGDSLWKLADTYTKNTSIDKEEYINEICVLNNISKDDIKIGQYLVISYYSTENK